MVRAANMKLTVDKETPIVNISGGGCPDVPYLAREMVGKSLVRRPPREIGHTLCGYALQLAYEEMKPADARRSGHHSGREISPGYRRGQTWTGIES